MRLTATVPGMPEPGCGPTTVVLEVEPESGPIRGIARDVHGIERRFSGWVELATAVERSLGETGDASAETGRG
jgi:hypothetical protein